MRRSVRCECPDWGGAQEYLANVAAPPVIGLTLSLSATPRIDAPLIEVLRYPINAITCIRPFEYFPDDGCALGDQLVILGVIVPPDPSRGLPRVRFPVQALFNELL